MLSYQHVYHAGNMADVHKHALLSVMLARLAEKPKPLSYFETHAGRGLYALDAPEAQKTGEAEAGIALAERLGWFGPDHPYARVLARIRARHGAAAYPGSPLIAAEILREGDRILLAELHPQEEAALAEALLPYPALCRRTDGLKMAVAVTPPEPRRGLMLIDPSYEVKEDYATLPRLVSQIHRKWNVGILALWYPILADGRHQLMLAELSVQNFPKALRHEVAFPPARDGHGMAGSGMFILNTPFGTEAEAARLTRLFAALAPSPRP